MTHLDRALELAKPGLVDKLLLFVVRQTVLAKYVEKLTSPTRLRSLHGDDG